MLKKEFKHRDVNRLRNIITGKVDEKTTIGVGYEKKHIHRNEGDIWEEDGKKWTIKDGIKQNVTKLDKIKNLYFLPLLCPKCNNPMTPRIDRVFYDIHKKCLNCVAVMETEIKREGKWEEYQNKIHNDEIDNLIKNFKVWVYEVLNQDETYISEFGDVEEWKGKLDKDKISINIEETVKYLESLKK
jgi:hypothetical protein